MAGGDWLEMLDDLQMGEGAELQTLLRSRDLRLLNEEIESAQFVKGCLNTRIGRLTSEVQAAVDDLASFGRGGSTSLGTRCGCRRRVCCGKCSCKGKSPQQALCWLTKPPTSAWDDGRASGARL